MRGKNAAAIVPLLVVLLTGRGGAGVIQVLSGEYHLQGQILGYDSFDHTSSSPITDGLSADIGAMSNPHISTSTYFNGANEFQVMVRGQRGWIGLDPASSIRHW